LKFQVEPLTKEQMDYALYYGKVQEGNETYYFTLNSHKQFTKLIKGYRGWKIKEFYYNRNYWRNKNVGDQ